MAGKADSTTRGPARWERAAVNAIQHPRSKAAKLYHARYTMALEISDNAVYDSAYQFMQPQFHGSGEAPTRRKYATCSIFCTILQISLDFTTVEKADLVDVFLGSHRLSAYGYKVLKLDPRSLSRPIRCQVCGGRV
jgi:hypothetical protein